MIRNGAGKWGTAAVLRQAMQGWVLGEGGRGKPLLNSKGKQVWGIIVLLCLLSHLQV